MKTLIAGGGTGGHLFPAVALAEALRDQDPGGRVLFVGTGNPLEHTNLSRSGFEHVPLVAGGLKGVGFLQRIRTLLGMPIGLWQAVKTIWRFKPDIVVGMGGYASGTVCLAARVMGKKMVVHEQNLLPGLTNRVLGRFAHRIFIAFPDHSQTFKDSKTVLTGNPVRRELLETEPAERSNEAFVVLVTGGSQGAHAINCAVVEALDHLEKPSQTMFVHQTGAKDAPWVRSAYACRGIEAKVEPFFEDMASAYHSADLVICRAGATTVAELAALGKPAIFVPFPFAANHHQELNARFVELRGGGEVILEADLKGEVLAERICRYASNRWALRDMSRRVSALGCSNAAEVIVDECRKLVGRAGES